MAEPVVRRPVVAGWGASRILLLLAFVVFVIAVFIGAFDKTDDLRDLFALISGGLALWVLASLV